MSYKIEKRGYEHNGFKLGDKVYHFDDVTIIIGFDTNAKQKEEEVVLKVFNDSNYTLSESDSANIILEGEENSSYSWAFMSNLEKF